MNQEELFYLLALQKVESVGDILAKKLLAHFGNAKEIFQSRPSKLQSIEGIGSVLIRNLKDQTVFKKAEKELAFITSNAIDVFFYQSKNYPEKLKHCFDAPILLFASGNFDFNNRKIISIVGTRQATPYGGECCRKLISDLAPLNPVIVSGFAYGIDIIAHQAAMEHNLQTIGIIAHGLNQIYPKAHKKYVSRMQENGGFMTDFWSSSNPDRENFIRRNRIVAGISEATIVMESAEKGGSLITANMANDYNRDVFAFPGKASDKYSQGCNNLIKSQKAQLLTSAADLIYMLNWDLQTQKTSVQKRLFIELDKEEQTVYNYLQAKEKELMDVIALECNFPVHKISSLLLNMELKGVVRPLPGKLFEVI